MTLRTDHKWPERTPIRFETDPDQYDMGARIVAAARAAMAMHLTETAMRSADEAALRALATREARQ